jgi:hypothetical protein
MYFKIKLFFEIKVPLALNVRSIELNIFFFVAKDETFLKLVTALYENAYFLR